MTREYITSRGDSLFVEVRGETVWTARSASGPWVDLADPRPFHTAIEKGHMKLRAKNDKRRAETVATFTDDEEAEFNEWLTRLGAA